MLVIETFENLKRWFIQHQLKPHCLDYFVSLFPHVATSPALLDARNNTDIYNNSTLYIILNNFGGLKVIVKVEY